MMSACCFYFEKPSLLRRTSLAKLCFYSCLVFFLMSVVFLSYLCPDNSCPLNIWSISETRYQNLEKLSLRHVIKDNMGKSVNYLYSNPFVGNFGAFADIKNRLSFDNMLNDNSFVFDIRGSDVIVFLHIQKTGGTSFGRHLVRDLNLTNPCECKKGRKRCRCLRPDSEERLWLFSRYTTGWKCGLHADWTELTNCVDNVMDESEKSVSKRRYFYITLLREPVTRFLSEFRHVQRGATWKSSRHWCGGRTPTPEELPSCYSGANWKNVTLEEFVTCPDNLAVNRQTRMLADLTLVGCYNKSIMPQEERDILLLASAKENLRRMAFFGFSGYQKMSQYLFESTFKLHFKHPFIQINETHSTLTMEEIHSSLLKKIRDVNNLDIQLYTYAKNLFFERFEEMKRRDPLFEYHYSHLGRLITTAAKNDNDAAIPEMKLIKRIEKQKKKWKKLKEEKKNLTALINKILSDDA